MTQPLPSCRMCASYPACPPEPPPRPGRIVTFYSYKGGVGRTSALANVATHFADSGSRVLIIDFDLEAPGLLPYFCDDAESLRMRELPGVLDILVAHGATHLTWQSCVTTLRDRLDYLGPGRQDHLYQTRLSAFDWEEYYERAGGALFDNLATQWKRAYDFVLIDSRTGISDFGGICTIQLPDVVVVMFSYNRQSVEGAAGMAQLIIARRSEVDVHARPIVVLPVPGRVELAEPHLLNAARSVARGAFREVLAHLTEADRQKYWPTVEMMYTPRLAYGEALARDVLDMNDPFLRATRSLADYIAEPPRATETEMTRGPLSPVPKVDIGILTVRDDEFRAVLDAFPQKAGAGVHKGASRQYILRHAEVATGERYTVAILRQGEQGTGEAQHAARDLIDDLAPKLVLVVGIAGGLPSDEVMLGDVVLGTRIHDYTVEAVKTGYHVTYAATGGPIDRAIAACVETLAGREDELGKWTSGLPTQPAVAWTGEGQVYGPPEWQDELRAKLDRHYGGSSSPRTPTYVFGPIASSDRLVKDPTVLFPWITTVRNLLAVEMESGGVYRAVRERCPMLAIRGISDIVGLKRADAWTKFACASAAAFARAFLRTRPVPVGASLGAADPR